MKKMYLVCQAESTIRLPDIIQVPRKEDVITINEVCYTVDYIKWDYDDNEIWVYAHVGSDIAW